MTAHEARDTVTHIACPRCGCHMRRTFECGCGMVHDDYCTNCGRFDSLPRHEFIDLVEFDAPCAVGPVPHIHTNEERGERMRAWAASLRRKQGKA